MQTLEDVRIDGGLFTMMKGEPGTRKSTQALSYPGPQYWVSADKKMESLVLPMKKWGIKPSSIKFDNYNEHDAAIAKLRTFQVNCPYKTIVIDSITSYGDNINKQTIKQKKAEGSGKKIGSIYVPGLEEYNAEASAFMELFDVLKDIHEYHKCHVIVIAHVVGQRANNDSNKLTHHSRVIITGGDKISGKISSQLTEVYHFNVDAGFDVDADSDAYGCYTKHTGNDYARSSLNLPKKITFNNDPLYEKFILPAQKKLSEEKPVERIGAPTVLTTPKVTNIASGFETT